MEKIFRKRTFPDKGEPIKSDNLTTPAWHNSLHKNSNKQLAKIFAQIGAKRLTKIAKRVSKIEMRIQKEKEALQEKLKQPLEQRSKIKNGLNEHIGILRKMSIADLNSLSFKEVKEIHALLGEKELNTKILKSLGMEVQDSYTQRDIPIESVNGVLHFISLVRANKIFREAKKR